MLSLLSLPAPPTGEYPRLTFGYQVNPRVLDELGVFFHRNQGGGHSRSSGK